MAGGFLIAVAILAGGVGGFLLRQPSLGLLIGAGTGLVLALLVWLLDSRR